MFKNIFILHTSAYRQGAALLSRRLKSFQAIILVFSALFACSPDYSSGAGNEITVAKGKVRLATVNCRPSGNKSIAENIEEFCAVAEEAGQKGADIVCLGEWITLIGMGSDYRAHSEPVPGSSTDRLGEVARKWKMYIVASVGEQDGEKIYNTAVLIDRQGKIAGKYHKVKVPDNEIKGGVTPGDSFPVFDTDFGRVGMMICWDLQFPEPARELAAQGAKVILLPIWGGDSTLARVRSAENRVYLVSCGYDIPSTIYGPGGELLALARERPGVATADVEIK